MKSRTRECDSTGESEIGVDSTQDSPWANLRERASGNIDNVR